MAYKLRFGAMEAKLQNGALSSDLTVFSYVVLVLVGREGAGPHDLVRMARQGRVYGDYAESQYYAEPKRLGALGYLRSSVKPGRTRPRTHYELTAKGRRAVTEWLRRPSPFSRFQLEPTWRLLAADLTSDAAALASLAGLRGDAAELLAQLDTAEAIAPTIPHRERYLRLNHRLARKLVVAHLEWLDEVERELGG